MALDHNLPHLQLTANGQPDASETQVFDWSAINNSAANDSDAAGRRGPAAIPSVTLWDEIAPEIPRAYRDDAEDASGG
ncbi:MULTISPECIES: hypothetical protein [unclassified Caballeronia]|uniref:hypothetical protein n=1 Tax=unclassified Caballeronia TaxID=2646786 RepID=UPI00158C4872|nr:MULTISPECIES: hypothetical protein [unclassified Caballeronia]QSN60572.1 hypothetical protein JYK05_09385 [Caballeronia sp. M1242]